MYWTCARAHGQKQYTVDLYLCFSWTVFSKFFALAGVFSVVNLRTPLLLIASLLLSGYALQITCVLPQRSKHQCAIHQLFCTSTYES
jgi:uncharacterized membrane protein